MKTNSKLVRSIIAGVALGSLSAADKPSQGTSPVGQDAGHQPSGADALIEKAPPPAWPHRVEAFYGSTTLKLLREPDRVEAFRLKENPPPNPYTSPQSLIEVEGPIAVDPASARELSRILTDNQSYGWDYYKGCLPEPGVKLRFVRRTAHTDVYFCFRCGTLMGADTSNPWAMANFDPASMKLAAVIKRIFPKTSESQLLH